LSLQPHIANAGLQAVVNEIHEVYDIDADDLRDLLERLEAGSARVEGQAGPLGTRPEAAPSAARIAARDGGLTVARSANTLMLPASLRSEP
jgi:CBS-domain-containing membrane protein